MIEAILYRLNHDSILSDLLGVTAEDTRIYPSSADNFGPCIVYSVSHLSGGHVRVSSLELRIIARSYALAHEIEKRLNELLDFKEGDGCDTGWISNGINIMSSVLNGGGELKIGEVYERFPTYSVKWGYV